MASTIPSIIVALTVVAVLIGIVGGIIAYYSKIYHEPVNLPAYGTIYVKEVNTSTYDVTIVNTFGQTVKVLFTVYVSKIIPPPNVTYDPLVSFWVDLQPGVTTINLLSMVKVNPPVQGSSYVIDLSKSYFIIGNTKYPIAVGAGALQPVQAGSGQAAGFSATGIGTLALDKQGTRYASLVFTDTSVGMSTDVGVVVGYKRSISDFEWVTKTTMEEGGYTCTCAADYFFGYAATTVTRTSSTLTVTTITTTTPVTTTITSPTTTTTVVPVTTTTWTYTTITSTVVNSYCAFCYTYVTTYGTNYYTYSQTTTFGCAYDNVISIYYVDLWSHISTKLNIPNLKGLNNFVLSQLATSNVSASSGSTYFVSTTFPYTLPPTACYYTYENYRYIPLQSTTSVVVCDTSCGYTYTYVAACKDNRILNTRTTLWACGSKNCASVDYFFSARLASATLNATSIPYSNKIYLRVNLTYAIEYKFIKDDPERAEDFVRFMLHSPLILSFPGIEGYIGVRYDEDLKSASVTLLPTVNLVSAQVKAVNARYTASFYPKIYAYSASSQATLTPVGYIALSSLSPYENAKTYAYKVSPISVSVNIDVDDWNSIVVPIYTAKMSDTIYITLIFDIYITPQISVQVQATQ